MYSGNRKGQHLPGAQSWERKVDPSPHRALVPAGQLGPEVPRSIQIQKLHYGAAGRAAVRYMFQRLLWQLLSLDLGGTQLLKAVAPLGI